MNAIKNWLLIMATIGLIGVSIMAIKNPDKYGGNIIQITLTLVTSIIALAKQNDDPTK